MPWVKKEMCTGCGSCVEECPVGVIALDGDGKAEINEDDCIRCGTCHDICPEKAVRHDSERIPELVEANLAWAAKLQAHFDTDEEKAGLRDRLRRFFSMKKKVIEKTLDGIENLS